MSHGKCTSIEHNILPVYYSIPCHCIASTKQRGEPFQHRQHDKAQVGSQPRCHDCASEDSLLVRAIVDNGARNVHCFDTLLVILAVSDDGGGYIKDGNKRSEPRYVCIARLSTYTYTNVTSEPKTSSTKASKTTMNAPKPLRANRDQLTY